MIRSAPLSTDGTSLGVLHVHKEFVCPVAER